MRNRLLSVMALILVIFGCKKDGDPFFDTFPKKYVYSRSSIKENVHMYADGKEIFDSTLIKQYVNEVNIYFTLHYLDSSYSNTILNFIDERTINYVGRYNYAYSKYYYSKQGNVLNVKTDTVYEPSKGPCRSFPYKVGIWKIDSVGVKIFETGTPNFVPQIPPIKLCIVNKKFTFVDNEIHIPVIGYRYSTYTSGGECGMATIDENEFNSDIVKDLRKENRLVIIKFDVVLKQE